MTPILADLGLVTVGTEEAWALPALPSTLALDPARLHLQENEEQPIDPF